MPNELLDHAKGFSWKNKRWWAIFWLHNDGIIYVSLPEGWEITYWE